MRILTFGLSLAAALLSAPLLDAGPILTLNPVGGALVALPGSAVGWGFTLTNDADYLVVASADYIAVSPIGTFTDFISPQFEVVGPSSSWTQLFDPVAQTGVGKYAIAAGTPLGALSTGFIGLTYDLYSVSPNDPNFDPDNDTISTGNQLHAGASVQAATPEPSTVALSGTGLALAAVLAGRRRQWAYRRAKDSKIAE